MGLAREKGRTERRGASVGRSSRGEKADAQLECQDGLDGLEEGVTHRRTIGLAHSSCRPSKPVHCNVSLVLRRLGGKKKGKTRGGQARSKRWTGRETDRRTDRQTDYDPVTFVRSDIVPQWSIGAADGDVQTSSEQRPTGTRQATADRVLTTSKQDRGRDVRSDSSSNNSSSSTNEIASEAKAPRQIQPSVARSLAPGGCRCRDIVAATAAWASWTGREVRLDDRVHRAKRRLRAGPCLAALRNAKADGHRPTERFRRSLSAINWHFGT